MNDVNPYRAPSNVPPPYKCPRCDWADVRAVLGLYTLSFCVGFVMSWVLFGCTT